MLSFADNVYEFCLKDGREIISVFKKPDLRVLPYDLIREVFVKLTVLGLLVAAWTFQFRTAG